MLNSWTKPRTWNGAENEYFELVPDYQRIRQNILYIEELLEDLGNIEIELLPMTIPTEVDIPSAEFFNTIISNIRILVSYTIYDIDSILMRDYVENDLAPNYRDLNSIENNLYNLFVGNAGVINVSQKIGYSLMGQLSIF